MNEKLTTALELHKAGLSVVPVMADGSKRPAGGSWKQYQSSRATPEEIHGWFTTGNYGVGIITGNISGNTELTEVEGRGADRLPELAQLATDTGLGDLWSRLCTGWLEQSPAGGWHWLYRLTDNVPGNTKLAQAATKETVAETRGTGGFVVLAPSAGTVHATGRPWLRIAGGPSTMPTITPGEREAFHALLGTLNEHTPETAQQDVLPETDLDKAFKGDGPKFGNGISPGDDFEAKTDWAQILTGWTLVFTRGNTRYWRRPGKTDPGFSATTGHADDRDRLYVFTTSTDFQAEIPYTKFGAYALLHHGGNHTAAAAALREAGHGEPPSTEDRTSPHEVKTTPPASITTPTGGGYEVHGNLATVTNIKKAAKPNNVTLTDHGNTQLFITRHGDHLRYAPSRGKWLAWDSARWAWQEDDGPAVEAAWETIDSITPENDVTRTHKHKSLSRRSLEAITGLARRDHRIRVNADQLDNEPFTLNTPAGLVDLRTGKTSPHDPARLHTKVTACAAVPGPTTLWDQLLNYAFEEHVEIIQFIQRLAGYAATGQVTHHILPFLFGSGGNGKSVFLDTLMAVLGDYATSAPAGFLMAGRDQHETEVARLAGMRLVVCSEVNQSSKFDEAKVKLLTGGDKLTARFMRQDHFSFVPSHTLFLMGNHQPKVDAGGESFWRRLRMLPFTRVVPEEQRIEGLAQRIIDEEGPAVLDWIIKGAVQVLQDGLQAPASVMAATDIYAAEEDALARFVADHVNIGGGDVARVNTAHMRTTYAAWCRSQGEKELSPQVFGRELRARFDVQQARSNGKRFYTNLTLLDLDELDEEQQAEHWGNR